MTEHRSEPVGLLVEPAALLERAWAAEPALRLSERYAALDRLEALVSSEDPGPTPPGRDWELELLAERAIDAAAQVRLDEARDLSLRVLETSPRSAIARARATLARGRELAWRGTEEATRQGDLVLQEAAALFADLGHRHWQAFAVFWRGQAICFENGRLLEAERLIKEALRIGGPDDPRRSTILTFYADVLLELGELDRAADALDQAAETARRDGDAKSIAYVAWGRARVATARDDTGTAERLLREVVRGAGDWFLSNAGVYFLCDAALLLDRLGLTVQADAYLEQARARLGEFDESIAQTEAMLMARSGDPVEALDKLQALVRGEWLERRQVWRHTLLSAWATFRAGRSGAGELAARALDQATAGGGTMVATCGEPSLVAALAPLAEQAGSQIARSMMAADAGYLLRLFGTPSLTAADGTALPLPAGMPGELVRLLALHEHGLPVDVVLETFFPDTAPATGRHRLRQVLTRLRAAAGEIVVRDGEHLRLADAWVDVREFVQLVARARSARGARRVELAYAALALVRGPLLALDSYAAWAQAIRDTVEYHQRELLDLIADGAVSRGSHEEALTALEAALELRPDDPDVRARLAVQLQAARRR